MNLEETLKNAKAFLFDLDGTLIDLPPKTFYIDYIRYCYPHFKDVFSNEDEFRNALLSSIQETVYHTDGKRNAIEIFIDIFAPKAGLDEKETLKRFMEFYNGDFDNLKRFVRSYPISSKLIILIKTLKRKAVLATNPVFPRIATEKRIKWGKLEPQWFDYITVGENSYYVKPQEKYYTNILREIGVDARYAVMIGNDYEKDTAAKKVGITTIMVDTHQEGKENKTCEPDFESSLKEIYNALMIIRKTKNK